MEDGAPEKLYEYINSNSLQSLITQICARSKSLLILWNFLKIGVAIFFEDATHRLSNILPMAFRTYRPWPFAHTPARNICGRSKLWCWRHRCTVRGSTLGAVYTSSYFNFSAHCEIFLDHTPSPPLFPKGNTQNKKTFPNFLAPWRFYEAQDKGDKKGWLWKIIYK